MNEILRAFGKAFDVPVMDNNSRIWFFRTDSGEWYDDFYLNGFIALGWNRVTSFLVKNNLFDKASRRFMVKLCYPEAKSHGHILGQLEAFYNKMKAGDMVIIPSEGSKYVSIGILGDTMNSIVRKNVDAGYEKCEHKHLRSVKWIKTIELWHDVYLFRAMRAQQTISDVTKYAGLVYRNLFPFYISDKNIHFTMQKISRSNYSLADNVNILSGIMSITGNVADIYGVEDFSNNITVKTAVGSPGVIEILFPHTLMSAIVVLIIMSVIGKEKNKDGSGSTGILAIIDMVNKLINDRENRRKIKAETDLIIAQKNKVEQELKRMQLDDEKKKAAVDLINELYNECVNMKKTVTEAGIVCDESVDIE